MKKDKLACLQQKEELLARIETQGQLIRNVEKEIYENVNQVLCLARINLVNLDCGDKNKSAEIVEQSGNLIGKAISDLRNLAKQAKEL
jgi:predicted P-loop ATPase/GTPase